MNRFVTLFGLVAFLLAVPDAFGQEQRFELFVGYSPSRNFAGIGSLESRDTWHGWNASLPTNVNSWLGTVTDFSWHYDGHFLALEFPFGIPAVTRRRFMSHYAVVGPQVTIRNGCWRPFARALFGISRVSEERAVAPEDTIQISLGEWVEVWTGSL